MKLHNSAPQVTNVMLLHTRNSNEPNEETHSGRQHVDHPIDHDDDLLFRSVGSILCG